jgi:hypothetical protein
MVGFFVAMAFEWGSERSTFSSLSSGEVAAAAAALLACVTAAAAAAAAGAGGARGLGAGIYESVLASLTATQRSGSGVTQVKVDQVVDWVVDACLTGSVHPVFAPLRDARDAGSTVATVFDSFLLAGEDRPDLPQ